MTVAVILLADHNTIIAGVMQSTGCLLCHDRIGHTDHAVDIITSSRSLSTAFQDHSHVYSYSSPSDAMRCSVEETLSCFRNA